MAPEIRFEPEASCAVGGGACEAKCMLAVDMITVISMSVLVSRPCEQVTYFSSHSL